MKLKVKKRTKATTRADRKMVRSERHRKKDTVVRTTKLVNAMTTMILDEVEIESGHWCMILVNESQNHNEMTEKSGSGNGANV